MTAAKAFVVRVAWISVLLATPAIRAQEERFWSFLEPGRVVTRCAESSAAHQLATIRLQQFDRRIRQLKETDQPAKAFEELLGLLRTECFLPASETERIPAPDTALSLKRWWSDGGRDWLASFLELPRLGPVEALTPHVVVPPDARDTLNLEAHRDHPLRGLLCELSDTACGAETRGWRSRADAYFAAHRALGRETPATADERPASGVAVTSQECAEEASKAHVERRYQQWRACVENRRPTRVALSLGEFKAPSAGWIVITGRRGHYQFCDTTRAYDLTAGTAFVHDSCSALVLEPDGQVDFEATDNARIERIAVGTISPANLQEAVWMLLFRGEAREVQVDAEYYPLPDKLIPQLTTPVQDDRAVRGGMWFNTGQTTLTWRWIPPVGPALAGELMWPDSYDAAESHAAALLDIAEQGFREGCAPAPARSSFASKDDRRLNDVSASAIRELDEHLRKALEKWRVLRCR